MEKKVFLVSHLNLSSFNLHLLLSLSLLLGILSRAWLYLLRTPLHRSGALGPYSHGSLQLNSLPGVSFCLGLGAQSWFPLPYSTVWCKSPGKWKTPLVFSSTFRTNSKATSQQSCNRQPSVAWEHVNLAGTSGPSRLEEKINWASVTDFYLPLIWERRGKGIFSPFAFLCFSLNRCFI